MAEYFGAWEGVSPLLLLQQLHDVVHVHPGRGPACTATAAHAMGSVLENRPACRPLGPAQLVTHTDQEQATAAEQQVGWQVAAAEQLLAALSPLRYVICLL